MTTTQKTTHTTTPKTISVEDPYSAWLHISRDTARPLNAYQLLGLRELDRDVPRIQAAIARRREQLEQLRGNKDQASVSEIWSRVLSEVNEAAETLLNLEEKAVLDARLRRHSTPAGFVSSAALDPAVHLACIGCGTANAGGRRFCSSCGQPLWSTCPECHAAVPASEQFCGGCGINLQRHCEQALAEANELLTIADDLAAHSRFDEALRFLKTLLISEDPRLEDVIREALKKRDEWRARLVQQQASTERAVRSARRHLQESEFEAAQQALAAIPESLCTDDVTRMLHDTTIRCREVKRLEELLRSSLHDKRYDTLGAAVNSLLALVPHHRQASALAPQVGRALESAASKRLLQGRYDRAIQMLEAVPQSARGESYESLRSRLKEINCLNQALRQAIHVDAATLDIAARLVQIAPTHADAASWNARLQTYARQHPKLGGPAPWVTPPARSSLGLPVTIWPGPRRIGVAPEAAATLCHRPEVFATAIGLALTALQRDGHSLQNIRPQRKRAPWMLSLGRRKAVRTAWGIDAGSSSMKIVELRILDGDKLRIERCWLRAINVASANRTPSFRNEELKRALEELDDNWKSRPDRVCLGMSSSATLMRRLRLPPMKDKQFRSAVQFEAQQVFPVPLDELYWDYQECPCDPPGTGGRHVLVLAARKPAVDLLLEPFDRQKLEVDVVQSGPLALQNLFSFETEADSKSQEPAGTTGILDLGAAASSLLALGNKTLWHRSLAACGDRLTSRIAQQLQLTREQAETLKHDVRRARDLHPLFAVIDPVIDDLRAELQRTLEAYLRDEPAQPLQQLILVGGAAGLHGLLRQLWFGGFGLAES